MSGSPTQNDARQRLLDAAGQVFAEKGYSGATIREICDRAGANVASVNYYFGDKEGIYRSVFEYAHGRVHDHLVQSVAEHADSPPEARLTMFVRAHLWSMLGTEGPPAWFSTLITREMIDPTHLQHDLVESELRPRSDMLLGIIRELLGPNATEDQVRHCELSVIGQSVFYKLARPFIEILHPEQGYDEADIEAMADHVASFSLAGIAAVKKQIDGEPS